MRIHHYLLLLPVVLMLSTCCSGAQGFPLRSLSTLSFKTTTILAAAAPYSSSSDDLDKHNSRQNATTTERVFEASIPKTKPRVYENVHYLPPPVVQPRRTKQKKNASSFLAETKHASKDEVLLWEAGQCFLEMGEHLQSIGNEKKSSSSTSSGSDLWNNHQRRLFQEAGQAVQDIGDAWALGDWEAVQYAALDASQGMKLIAQSLNKRHAHKNELQQALAGVAVELKSLSEMKDFQPQTGRSNKHNKEVVLPLAGLCLRFFQASQSCCVAAEDSTTSTTTTARMALEGCSKAAQSLARIHGAKASFLPRRFRLWWHYSSSSSRQRQEQP